jgi:CelD/BcsL family acetyltransferase involved in cellulose biosynthesis
MDADAEAGLFMTAGGSNGRTAGATSGSANARSVAGAASGAPGIALRTVATEADLLSLQPRWDVLARRQERQFVEQRFFSAQAAWDEVQRPKGRRLHVIVGEIGDRLVLVLPLVEQRIGPIRIAHWLGPDNYEVCDVLLDPEIATLDALTRAFALASARFALLRFPAMRRDARLWPLLKTAPYMRGVDVRSPFLDCSRWPDFATYLASRSQGFRQDTKKSMKRLRASGRLKVEVVADAGRANGLLRWMLDRKSEWLVRSGKDTRAIARFADKTAYFKELVRASAGCCELAMVQVRVDDVTVAAQLGFRMGDIYAGQMLAWDAAWQASGPGRVVATETIRWGFENGIRMIDLGLGSEDYKYRLTDRDVPAALHVVVATGWAGAILLKAERDIRNFIDQSRRRHVPTPTPLVAASERTLRAAGKSEV